MKKWKWNPSDQALTGPPEEQQLLNQKPIPEMTGAISQNQQLHHGAVHLQDQQLLLQENLSLIIGQDSLHRVMEVQLQQEKDLPKLRVEAGKFHC